MTTINDFLAKNIIKQAQDRLEKLRALDAPEIIIKAEEAKLQNPTKDISGIKKFGSVEFVDFTQTTGKGGKRILFFHRDGQPDIVYCKGNWGGMSLFESTK